MKIAKINVFSVVVLTMLLIMGCKFGAGENVNDAPVIGGSSKTTSTNASSDPQEVIRAALKNIQESPSWAAEVATSSDVAPQSDSKMEVEYIAPDRFHIENESNGSQFEVIVIGTDAYLLANGKWQKAPVASNMGQMINNWKQMYNTESVKAFKNIEFVGEESVAGKQALVYAYRIDPLAAMPEEARAKLPEAAKNQLAAMTNDAKIWIDAEKNLPLKLELNTKLTQPKEIRTKMVYEYKYDREVKIEAPKLSGGQ